MVKRIFAVPADVVAAVFDFAFMGAANLYVAYHFSESAWVSFKLFGGLGLMFAFVLAQAALLARYVEDKP